ncbi:amino acid adenylation domain-containing protein [Vibrio parahaemolyticus]|nr:amino acid adenylation domain-containing protein [Vibrio parahaemolyticus]ELC3209721.1 amino acid adenylation domain-containing protein [Vibrio parahaemolyticus]
MSLHLENNCLEQSKSSLYSSIEDILPVTSLQEALLLRTIEFPDDRAYLEQVIIRLHAPVNIEKFQQSLTALFKRHAGLRARFIWDGLKQPVQTILPLKESLPFEVVEYESQDSNSIETYATDWLARQKKQGHDISKDAIQVCLVQNQLNAALLLSWHHILLDGWSLANCLKELFADYEKEISVDISKSKTSPKYLLPSKNKREQDRQFWREHLQAAEPTFLIGFDNQMAVTHQHKIMLNCGSEVAQFCAGLHVTPASLYYTVWGMVVQRWTYCRDVLFGTVFSGREKALDSDQTVGMFINTLPIRSTSSGSDTVANAVMAMHENIQSYVSNQAASLADITQMVNPGERGNIFDSLFVVENYPLDTTLIGGASDLIDSVSLEETTEFPISVTVMDVPDGIQLHVTVRSSSKNKIAQQLATLWACLVKQMITAADTRLADLQNMTAGRLSEQHARLQADVFTQPYRSILDVVWQQARVRPEAIALVDASRKLNYRAMVSEVDQRACALYAQGVRCGDYIGVITNRSIDTVLNLMAVHRIGAVYVPISENYPIGRIAEVVKDFEPKLLICQPDQKIPLSCPTFIPQHQQSVPSIDLSMLARPNPSDPAYVIYSSGSTGKPKGIVVPFSAMPRLILEQFELLPSADSCVLLTSAFEFDVSVFEMWSTLAQGAKLVIPSRVDLLDAESLDRWITSEGVTQAWFITSLFNAHVASGADFFAKMERVIIGGEALSASHVRQAIERFPKLQLFNGYGPTENTILTTYMPLSAPIGEPVPIGYAIHGTSLQVLDLDNNLLPHGALGQLATGGVGVALGYINHDEYDRNRFIEDPYNMNKKRFLTGDLVQAQADGTLVYHGRLDNQVKIRGNRLDLSEVEQRLLAVPQVNEAAVLLLSDQHSQQLVGFYKSKAVVGSKDILKILAEHLPYWALPDYVFQIDKFPELPNGKLDRLRLIDLGQKYVEDLSTEEMTEIEIAKDHEQAWLLETSADANSGNILSSIRSAWQIVLDKTDISDTTPFFDAGGTSLLIIRLKSLLTKKLGQPVAVTDLFSNTTISEQARFFRKTQSAQIQQSNSTKPDSSESIKYENKAEISSDDIAIIGMSGRFPNAANVDELWELVKTGRSAIHRFSTQELIAHGVAHEDISADSYVPAKGILADVDKFDANFFGYSERQANLMDPQVRLLHQVCWDALESSGQADAHQKYQIGLYVGVLPNPTWMNHVLAHTEIQTERYEAANLNLQAPQALISHSLGLTGPSVLVDTACSTSAAAIHIAAQALLASDCDIAIAGAASIEMPVNCGYHYVEGMIHSKDGYCRPFDAKASGTVTGDGVAVIVLKRLKQALADKDPILATLKASAINNDGNRKVGYTAPSVQGQSDVIEMCLNKADFAPETIGLIEAHGTATSLGDPIEAASLAKVYGDIRKHHCVLGSIKGTIGHLNSTAGVAGVIKAVSALRHKVLPPNPNFEHLNPEIPTENFPFHILTKSKPWLTPNHHGRRAVVSSFGIGGTNVHLALEEAPLPENVAGDRAEKSSKDNVSNRIRFFPFSAADPISLTQRAQSTMADAAARRLLADDVEITLRSGRRALTHRMVAMSQHDSELFSSEHILLADWVTGQQNKQPSDLVFLFPGQGTQYVGMGRGLYRDYLPFAHHLDELAAQLQSHVDFDVHHWLHIEPTETILRETRIVQPLLFIMELALARCLIEVGLKPDAMIGHSLGEFTAATLAEVFDVNDALGLVAKRGRLMQALPSGVMYSVKQSKAELTPLLEYWPGIEIATVNMRDACVVAGPEDKIQLFFAQNQVLGQSAVRLDTSHAFHTQMMDGMLEDFEEALQSLTLNEPTTPFISNVTGCWITPQQAMDPKYWCQHTRNAVLFDDGLSTLLAERGLFVEVGPGSVLTNLSKRHSHWNSDKHTAIDLLSHKFSRLTSTASDDWRNFSTALARLWCVGAPLSWQMFDHGVTGQRQSLALYPFKGQSYWKIGQSFEPLSIREKLRAPRNEWARQPIWWPLAEEQLMMPELGNLCIVPVGNEATDVVNELANALHAHEITYQVISNSDKAALAQCGTKHTPVYWLLVVNATADPLKEADAPLLLINQFLDSLRSINEQFGPRDKICLLTSGAFAVLDSDVVNPVVRAVAGAAMQVQAELTATHIAQCDLPASGYQQDWMLPSLLGQLYEGKNDAPYLACRNGKLFNRHACAISPANLPKNTLPDMPTIWIFGARGAIGSVLTEYWLKQSQVKVVLFARKELRADQISKYDQLARQYRSTWHYHQLDVTQPQKELLLSPVLAAGLAPDHICFAVGNVGSTMLHKLDQQALNQEVCAKILGTAQCLADIQALGGLNANVVVTFCSSIASETIGTPGQIAYGAANAWLDGIADYCSKKLGIHCLSLGWDSWQERGMAARLIQGETNDTAPLPFQALFEQDLLDKSTELRKHLEHNQVLIRLQRPNDWVIDQHTFKDMGIMPATGFLFLALEHLNAVGVKVAVLDEATVLTPLTMSPEEDCLLLIEREEHPDHMKITIRSRSDLFVDRWTTHFLAKVNTEHSAKNILYRHGYDMTDDMSMMQVALSDLYQTELHYAGPWHCIDSVYSTSDKTTVRATLSLPTEYQSETTGILIHPALLDVAIGLWERVSGEGLSAVPFTFDQLSVTGPIGNTVQVSVTPVVDRSGGHSLALTLYGETGHQLTCQAITKRQLPTFPTSESDASNQKTARQTRVLPTSTNYTLTQNEPGNLQSLQFKSSSRVAPGPNEVEIEVLATGLSFKDVLFAAGKLPQRTNPNQYGLECAGRVVRIGDKVVGLQIGDDVVTSQPSSFSRFLIAPDCTVVPMPRGYTYEAASTLPVTYLTAWIALKERARLKPKERVLLHAAAGGVGLSALYVAKYIGADIFVTAGSEDKRQRLEELGVTVVGSTRDATFETNLMKVTNNQGVDVVLNALTGELLDAGVRCLSAGGRFVELGVQDIHSGRSIPMNLFSHGRQFIPVGDDLNLEATGRGLKEIVTLVEQGHLPCLPMTVFGADEVNDAFSFMAGARHYGKITITHRNRETMNRLNALLQERTEGAFACGFSDQEALALYDVWAGKSVPNSHILLSSRSQAKLLTQNGLSQYQSQRDVAANTNKVDLRPRPKLTSSYRSSQTEHEKKYVSLFEQHLGISPVGVDDNFFELGATSLDIVQIAGKLSAISSSSKVVDFYEYPTISRLARHYQGDGSGSLSIDKNDYKSNRDSQHAVNKNGKSRVSAVKAVRDRVQATSRRHTPSKWNEQ